MIKLVASENDAANDKCVWPFSFILLLSLSDEVLVTKLTTVLSRKDDSRILHVPGSRQQGCKDIFCSGPRSWVAGLVSEPRLGSKAHTAPSDH